MNKCSVVLLFSVLSLFLNGNAQKRNYISAEAFIALADYKIMDTNFLQKGRATCSFDPAIIKKNSIVFVQTNILPFFFAEVFPLLKEPIILITHNSVASSPGKFACYLDDKRITMWFGKNSDIVYHPKFCPIPLGLADQIRAHGDKRVFDKILDELERRPVTKKLSKLYLNINVKTNSKVRAPVYKYFKKKSFVTETPRKSCENYLQDMMHHKYVLSPFGRGLDCHRTWEALLVGAVPVVKRSTLDPLYQDLPVIIVDDWHQVTLSFLEKEYEELRKKTFNRKKLFLDYWVALIKSYQ